MDVTWYYFHYTTQDNLSNAKPTLKEKKIPTYYFHAGSLFNEIPVYSDSEERLVGMG